MPLNILIIGAGLGGLGAAIALNQAGHNIQVLEKSSFLTEVGAAIHAAPNATRVLKRWGIDLDQLQAVHCESTKAWDKNGNLVFGPVASADLKRAYGVTDEWLLTHRVDLHNTLRRAAEKEVEGRRVEMKLGARVASVNAAKGEVTLEDGTMYTADLVVGADGLHSRCAHAIPNIDTKTISTNQRCFRFLVPVSKLKSNALTATLLDKMGLDGLNAFCGLDRRLVMYPCRRGTLMNVAAICPESETEPGAEAEAAGEAHDGECRAQLLHTYRDFSPELRELCSMAEDVKLWSLASRDPAPTFVFGKLALLGDAAHPMLPHQGQGGAQALEDAAVLGAMLSRDTTASQIPERLAQYNRLRYAQAVTVMMMSRVENERRAEMLGDLRRFVPHATVPEDMWAFAWMIDPVGDVRERHARL